MGSGSGIFVPAYQEVSVKFSVTITDSAQWPAETCGDNSCNYKLENAYGNDITVVALPDLVRSKWVSIGGQTEVKEGVALPGSVLTYHLRVDNTGGGLRSNFVIQDNISDIIEYVTLNDGSDTLIGSGTVIAGGTILVNAENQYVISWPPENVAAGGHAEKFFQVKVKDPLTAGGDYSLRNVYGDDVTVVTIPDVIISKEARNINSGQTSSSSIDADETHVIEYSLQATNSGSGLFSNFIFEDNLTDVLQYSDLVVGSCSPANCNINASNIISWPASNIPAGATLTRTFRMEVKARASWPAEPVTGWNFIDNNNIPNLMVVGQKNDLRMTNVYGNQVEVLLPGGIQEVDLEINKTATAQNATTPPSGPRGSVINYQVDYRNSGDLGATGVEIVDSFIGDQANLILDAGSIVTPVGVTALPADTDNDGRTDQIIFTI